MNGFRLWLSELKHIGSNKKVLIPFVAVLMIPLIYSAMFLWAFWNPYENMDQLPVAVVNMDDGSEFNGESLNIGEEFVDQLSDSGDFEYHMVSEQEGYNGLKDQDYYMLVEIPKHFSDDATTILDDEPKKLQLKYVPNEGYNFLSAQIGETATEQMKQKLSSEMTETYVNAMFTQFSEVQSGLTEASDKASDLNNGASELNDGVEKIEKNLKQLAAKQVELAGGTATLRNGTSELASGTQELNQGLGQLSEAMGKLNQGQSEAKNGAAQLQQGIQASTSGAAELEQGLEKTAAETGNLQKGAAQLAQSVSSLNQGSSQLSQSAGQLQQGIQQLEASMSPLLEQMDEEQRKNVLAQLEALKSGTSSVNEAAGQLAEGSKQIDSRVSALPGQVTALHEAQVKLHKGSAELAAGQQSLQSGADALLSGEQTLTAKMQQFAKELNKANNGSADLVAGAAQVNKGAQQLASGSNQLADGSSQLRDGATELYSGSTELASGALTFQESLNEASTEASSVQLGQKVESMMASPVGVNKASINHVPNYGTGFTPYFLSLGLFVGALLITIVYPVKQSVAEPRSGLSWFVSKYSVLATAGIVQALVAASVILYGLGLEVGSTPLFYGFSILTSLTFMALIQMLVSLMGDPGRFVAIIILILQLTTSAGTFPLELIPQPLQAFNPLLPMTYSVSAFKSIISDAQPLITTDTLAMLGFMVGSMLITIIYFSRILKRKTKLQLAS
ncbi:YhgE/Pip domain-containing protein [Halobacillus litoralis]|uniref:YhgE/Pip domain-containing protein n=1 Tax=Halobacillus litoralis TaxID=45668 RepID=UPI001CD5CC0C|nr:YhgE/Pip domain-containing protein [Halobacillus litoralis]MCA0970453.1 YhgE/Pip domain-containing protein [Halobacillus litoralis]